MRERYIIPVLLLCLAACTSDALVEPVPDVPATDTAVGFSAAISGGSPTRANTEEEDTEYLHEHFIYEEGGRQSRIRVVNTVNYSVPDFTDATQYKEYAYVGNGAEGDDPTKPNFTPWTGTGATGGFDWDQIRPTAANFVFEAACYPNSYEPFGKVPENQSEDITNFLKADLLLAHHRQDLSARYDLVKLKFWHAFAMIRVEITLPVTGAARPGGFPEDAIQEVWLVNRQIGYEVDYTSSIDNDGLRPVTATGEAVGQVKMFPLVYAKEGGTTAERTQSYVYCGIIPAQSIVEEDALVQFSILTYTGDQVEEGVWEEAEEKKYNYVPRSANIPIEQAHITILQLGVDVETQETILLDATVQSWGERYTEMPLEPDTPEDNID